MIDIDKTERDVTDDDIERWSKNAIGDHLFGPHIVNSLCVALRRERKQRADNPGVWDGAPEWATEAWIQWRDKTGKTFEDISHAMWSLNPYRRTLPKTKAREIAENAVKDGTGFHAMINGVRAVDVIEQAILEYEKQTKGE